MKKTLMVIAMLVAVMAPSFGSETSSVITTGKISRGDGTAYLAVYVDGNHRTAHLVAYDGPNINKINIAISKRDLQTLRDGANEALAELEKSK